MKSMTFGILTHPSIGTGKKEMSSLIVHLLPSIHYQNDPSSFMIEKHTPRHMCTQWQALSPPSILHINICIYMYLIAGADIL